MSEIDLVKYGVLWQKVEGYGDKFDHLEKKMDKMESQLDKLVEASAKQQGAAWLATGVLAVLSTLGGWLLHWWLK
jgi:response regulator of citrate/malate metabolism